MSQTAGRPLSRSASVDDPVFIVGADRSGTSLLYSLLASHPNLSMVRRTNMWRYFYGRYGDLSQTENFERCLVAMTSYKRMRHLQPDPARIRQEFQAGPPTYGRLFGLIHEHHMQRAGKSRWGDKSLHTEHHVDQVMGEFPHAKILHMLRDPRDRCASMQKRYHRNEGRVAAATGRWLASAGLAQSNSRRYPEHYLVVRYETLAAEPESTLRTVCAFIGEPYVPSMLAMEAVPELRQRGGNSSFGQYEAGVISTRSIGRYRTVLSQSEIAFIQLLAGRKMARYDYAPEPLRFSAQEKVIFALVDLPLNTVRMAGWMAANAVRMRREPIPAAKVLARPSTADPTEATL